MAKRHSRQLCGETQNVRVAHNGLLQAVVTPGGMYRIEDQGLSGWWRLLGVGCIREEAIKSMERFAKQ